MIDNYWSKKERNKRLFNANSRLLTKENLKEFIDNYPTNYTGDYRDQCYVDGIKDVLADLEATFLWEAAIEDRINNPNQKWIKIPVSNITKEEITKRLSERGYKIETSLDGYLEEEGIIDKVIEIAKANLAKYKDPNYVPF